MIMERGGRRRSRAADGYVPGHTVKNRMTVIFRKRWRLLNLKDPELTSYLISAPFFFGQFHLYK